MPKLLKEKIIGLQKLASSIYKMTIESPYVSQNSIPGQFINIKCADGLNALLRRPISICDVDRTKNTFDIVFQIKGTGTELLSKMQPGDIVDFIAPIGKGFDLDNKYSKIAVVGGGIGIFPLLNLLKASNASHKAAYIGFRNTEFAVLTDEFKAASDALTLCSDDGSIGYKGLVVEPLIEDIKNNKYELIYTCGPTPMIKRVSEIAKENNIKCQVSLEQRMGCGIGACLVCACKTRLGDEWEYSHVCVDGPVFWSDEVIFDE